MYFVIRLIGVPEQSLRSAFAPLGNFARHIKDHFIPHARNNYHPHLLGHRNLALMSAMLLAVKVFTLTALTVGPIAPAFSSAITSENIISLTNQSRSDYGLGTLTNNGLLAKAAQAKADDMLARGYFSHNTPDGKTPWTFITAAGYGYMVAGENLAVNFTEAENVEDAWMNSPGHKANILNKNFEEIGIGISQGVYQGHEAIFVVQMFGSPSEQKVTLSEEPTKVVKEAVPAPAQVQKAEVKEETKTATAEPKALGDTETSLIDKEPVAIASGEVKVDGQDAVITAQVKGPAVKVLAYFGEQAVMLEAKDNNTWKGSVALSSLASSESTVKLKAFDINNKTVQLQLADFSAGTLNNFNLGNKTPEAKVSFLGKIFNPKDIENRFYLFFVAGILSSLILAIAIKKHIHHVMLVANSSFVVILAMFLWWVG